jgi:hypothetical protein
MPRRTPSAPDTLSQFRELAESYRRGPHGKYPDTECRWQKLVQFLEQHGLPHDTLPEPDVGWHPHERHREWLTKLGRFMFVTETRIVASQLPAGGKADTAPPSIDFGNYMPAKDCRAEVNLTPPSGSSAWWRSIRHAHKGVHLFIHAGDWQRYKRDLEKREGEATDAAAERLAAAQQEHKRHQTIDDYKPPIGPPACKKP